MTLVWTIGAGWGFIGPGDLELDHEWGLDNVIFKIIVKQFKALKKWVSRF